MIKPTKWHVCPAKTQISLGIHPIWSESSLSAWRKLGSLATHWVHSEDSDQTGQMPRLIWVFRGCTVILLVLSWGGSISVFNANSVYMTIRHFILWHLIWVYTVCQCVLQRTIAIKMSHVMRKPVYGVCDQVRLKPACSVTETS